MMHRCHQSGATLIEAILAIGLLGLVTTAGFYQMNSINHIKKNLARGQAIDVIEFANRDLLERSDVIAASVTKSGNPKLKSCFEGKGCEPPPARSLGIPAVEYPLDMYLPGDAQPFAGARAFFDESGSPCLTKVARNPKKKCEPVYRMRTFLLVGCKDACQSPNYAAIRFGIEEIKTKRILRKGSVDRTIASRASVTSFNLECPDKEVLRGIGIQGEPLCVPIDKLNYQDPNGIGSIGNAVTINVKPKDCRTLNAGADDQWFVFGYNENGEIQCNRKTW